MPANPPTQPLHGWRIALTVADDDPISPAHALRAHGATTYAYPVAQTLPPDTYAALDRALLAAQRGDLDWLLLTTPCAVDAVAQRMAHLNLNAEDFKDIKFALYGAVTRNVAATRFPTWASHLPSLPSHAQVVDAMQLRPDDAVLIPLAQRTRADWYTLISATGAEAIAADAYRLLLGRGGDDLPGLLWGGMVDALVFFTENSVRHFVVRLKVEGGSLDMLHDVVITCLDQQTARAAQAYGLTTHVIAAHESSQHDDPRAAWSASLADYLRLEAVNA